MSDRIATILEKLIDRIIRERNEVIAENEKLRDEIERLQAENKQYQNIFDLQKATIERLQEERRWIPVSERKPEKSEYYLALLMGWNIPTIASFSTYKNECLVKADDMWYVRIDGDWTGVETVTHWMPLPPPPEAE